MRLTICDDRHDVGFQAAKLGSLLIRKAIAEKGRATVMLATGLSQVSMYETLVNEPIDWSKVEAFHLDEYVGIPADHPASFRNYLKTRFIDHVGPLMAFHPIEGDAEDLAKEVKGLNAQLGKKDIDVAFLGIGENGHIAFNDPPADMETTDPYITVDLEMRCRKQQVSEHWFPSLDEVPTKAVSLSVRRLLKAESLVCSVPDRRKARAVAMCLYDQISPYSPCTILRTKENCSLFLDRPSSMLILGDRRQTS